MRDLYCFECSLQFDKKYVFDVHLSLVHGEELEIKQEPESRPSVIPESKELEITHPEEDKSRKIESKRIKVAIRTVSGHEGKKQFKSGICIANFVQNDTLNKKCCDS